MATTVTTSGLGKLNWRDIIEGLKIAAILPALSIIYTSIENKSFNIDWTLVWQTAAFGAVGYLIKKITTPAQVIIKDVKPETIEAIKDGVADVKVITK
jgi:hypothetical protein